MRKAVCQRGGRVKRGGQTDAVCVVPPRVAEGGDVEVKGKVDVLL